jgi:hypothetical protein
MHDRINRETRTYGERNAVAGVVRDQSTDWRRTLMDLKIKMTVEYTVSESGLEDALAEFDELTVEGLMAELLDKSIACDTIAVKVVEGPNTLEEFDEATTQAAAS